LRSKIGEDVFDDRWWSDWLADSIIIGCLGAYILGTRDLRTEL
jgi:hypothetical protein